MVGIRRSELSLRDRFWVRVALYALTKMSNAAGHDLYAKMTFAYRYPRRPPAD